MSYAANAYAKTSRSVLTAREAESAVLTKASQRLQMVRDDWANQSGELDAALNFNQKVWTILASAATDPANPLPDEIRLGISRLSVYVFRTIIDAMIAPSREKIESLVSLNNHIAAGLQGDPGAGA